MLIFKLILAHLLGDFFLQPKTWVKHKKKYRLKSYALYLHVFVHIALLYILIWDLTQWYIPLIIGASHLIIDSGKVLLETKNNKRSLFFIDQLLHLATLFIVFGFTIKPSLDLGALITESSILTICCLLFLTQPVAIVIQVLFSKWDIKTLTKDKNSLKDAGRYIGILERVLVFIFIITNHWEAVGFLITAKSVFRFGDLKEAKHRKLTEYILIGTLVSFGIAIVTGLIFQVLIRGF